MERRRNGKERGKGRGGSRELDMINHHHLSLDNAVQCVAVGVGNPFFKILHFLIPQSNNPAKILPQDTLKDKM